MVERGDGGAIVNVSSVASHHALKDHLAYCEYTMTARRVCSVAGVPFTLTTIYSVTMGNCVCVCVCVWCI